MHPPPGVVAALSVNVQAHLSSALIKGLRPWKLICPGRAAGGACRHQRRNSGSSSKETTTRCPSRSNQRPQLDGSRTPPGFPARRSSFSWSSHSPSGQRASSAHHSTAHDPNKKYGPWPNIQVSEPWSGRRTEPLRSSNGPGGRYTTPTTMLRSAGRSPSMNTAVGGGVEALACGDQRRVTRELQPVGPGCLCLAPPGQVAAAELLGTDVASQPSIRQFLCNVGSFLGTRMTSRNVGRNPTGRSEPPGSQAGRGTGGENGPSSAARRRHCSTRTMGSAASNCGAWGSVCP